MAISKGQLPPGFPVGQLCCQSAFCFAVPGLEKWAQIARKKSESLPTGTESKHGYLSHGAVLSGLQVIAAACATLPVENESKNL